MGYARQTTRLEALELQTRRAMYAMEQRHVADLRAQWLDLQGELKDTLAGLYAKTFGQEPADYLKAKTSGFNDMWAKTAAAKVDRFAAASAARLSTYLKEHRKEEALRQAWMLDMTTPREVRVKVPPARAREAAAPLLAKANWVLRWSQWLAYYAEAVGRNITMATFNDADMEAMLKKVEATKVGAPAVDAWAAMERMARTEMLMEQEAARQDIAAANEDVLQEEIWQTMEDLSVCDVCRDNYGKGKDEADSDIPAHPNCRCFWRLVPKTFKDLLAGPNQAAAQAMDEKGLVPDSLVVWDDEQETIKAMAVVEFGEWKAEQGMNAYYG